MKKFYSLLIAVLLTEIGFSQAPQKMSYQAVIRNSSDQLVINHAVGMRVSILQGSSTGTPVYVETQTPTTNTNGLISIEIGSGTVINGTVAGIDWSTGPYFIKTETDPVGGSGYTISGTSQLLSVPYALYAKTASDAATKRYVDSLNQQLKYLRDRLYYEFPTMKDLKATSEQIINSGKTGFGNSISVSGNLAVIGAGWENTDKANKAGAVYVYEYDGSKWIEKQRITNPNGAYDNIFGQSVATNGTYIVIGEPNAHSAYIYSKVGTEWILEKKFTVTNVSSESYGISSAVYGNTVVIGSGTVFAMYCSAIGSAYVYEKNGTEWTNTSILTPSGGLAHDGFGSSLSIYENVLAVGASKGSCYAGTQGYVCIYEKNGSNWIETHKLIAPDGANGDRFGQRVDIEKGQLLVASPGIKGVYYFQKGNSWEFKQKIISPNLTENDNFGSDISLFNNNVLIGAYTHSEAYTSQGGAYLFEFDGTNWNNKLKIIPSDAAVNDGFGCVLFLDNNNAFVSKAIQTVNSTYAYSLR
jgi:hypothetical protein